MSKKPPRSSSKRKKKQASRQGVLVRRARAGERGALAELLRQFPARGREVRAERREFQKRSKASKAGWKKRRLHQERKDYAPNEGAKVFPTLYAGTPESAENQRLANHFVLRAMVDTNHILFKAFRKRGSELGLSKREILNEWFSPKIRKGRGR